MHLFPVAWLNDFFIVNFNLFTSENKLWKWLWYSELEIPFIIQLNAWNLKNLDFVREAHKKMSLANHFYQKSLSWTFDFKLIRILRQQLLEPVDWAIQKCCIFNPYLKILEKSSRNLSEISVFQVMRPNYWKTHPCDFHEYLFSFWKYWAMS